MSQVTSKTNKTKSKVTVNLLSKRRIQTRASNQADQLLSLLKDRFFPKVPVPRQQNVKDLLEDLKENLLQSFQRLDTTASLVLDQLRYQLDKSHQDIHHPFTHSLYFESQLRKCSSGNEHVLQRTIMMNIFHPYWLPPRFDWNTEGQWNPDPDSGPFAPPSNENEKNKDKNKNKDKDKDKDKDKLSRPRPDLTFAFARDAFLNPGMADDLVPEDLELAFSPEGGDRVFPFLFIEVKKGDETLTKANLSNLNNAGQALYNIHRWCEKAKKRQSEIDPANGSNAEQWSDILQTIRLFTFAFNAEKLVVRTHRAVIRLDGEVTFCFAELFSKKTYDRDQICNLFNKIVYEYANKELFDKLKVLFKAVTGITDNETTTEHASTSRGGVTRPAANAESDGRQERSRQVENGNENDVDEDASDDGAQTSHNNAQSTAEQPYYSQGKRNSPGPLEESSRRKKPRTSR